VRWPWHRRKERAEPTDSERALEESRRRAELARDARIRAQEQARTEWHLIVPRLAVSGDEIADEIERSLRRGRHR
jgi:hypothetical protein